MIPRREEGVTHVIEFTFALTLFLIIIQAFSTTMDFRIGVDLDSNDNRIAALVREHFDLRPRGIIEMLDLRRPIYRPTASYGHFGREGFSWENTDKADALKAAL